MIKILIITIFSVSILQVCYAKKKPRKKDLIRIENEIGLDNFYQAAEESSTLLKEYPDDPYLNLLYGTCLLNINSRIGESIPPLEFAQKHYNLDSKPNEYAIEANYSLGKAYHLKYRFSEALDIYTHLQGVIPEKRTELREKITREIKINNNAIALKNNPIEFRITNMGQAVNSEYDEHSPVVSGDESLMMFTSNRQGTGVVKGAENLFSEDIYQTVWREGRWLPSTNTGTPTNTKGYEATCSIGPDGKTLITYRYNGNGNLYISNNIDGKWNESEKLPKPINSAYDESHGSLSPDGNTLIFTSDRPGGLGGKDIYFCRKLPDGSWGKLINPGEAINTPYDEESPFLSYDGKILYFASEGHTSMGGFDIFKSELNKDNAWNDAQNIGYPVNTTGDDLFYIPTYDGQRVYFASVRPGGYGRSDIYIIEFPETDERSLGVVSGFLYNEDGSPSTLSKITVTKEGTGETVGIYKPQPDNGKYTMILPTGIAYEMSVETSNKTNVLKSFELPVRSDYKTRASATFLDPIIIKD